MDEKLAAVVKSNPTPAPRTLKRAPRTQIAYSWAWELEDGSICRWSEVTLEELTKRGGPGGWAAPVLVVMMTAKEYRKMRRDAVREWRRAK